MGTDNDATIDEALRQTLDRVMVTTNTITTGTDTNTITIGTDKPFYYNPSTTGSFRIETPYTQYTPYVEIDIGAIYERLSALEERLGYIEEQLMMDTAKNVNDLIGAERE